MYTFNFFLLHVKNDEETVLAESLSARQSVSNFILTGTTVPSYGNRDLLSKGLVTRPKPAFNWQISNR